tara:strand:+ start:36 stop:554 length:519 start_codon:yes stop_codon:yes gene_type:complete
MIDFIFPQNNESEFIEIATKLNYKKLCLIYSNYSLQLKEKISKLQEKTKIKLLIGIKTKKPIGRDKADYILTESSQKNQPFLEKPFFNILYNCENTNFNQVLCKLAKKNGITLAFSFSNFLSKKQRLTKNTKLNLKLAKKYNLDVIFASFASKPYQMRNHYDILSFFNLISR